MFNRLMVKGGVGLAGVALGASGAYIYSQTESPQILRSNVNSDYFKTEFHPSTFNTRKLEPVWKWNKNWDGRQPDVRITDTRFSSLSDDDKAKKQAEFTPSADRHIFLIRHGQYHLDSHERNLTPLGKEQAVFLGKRLSKGRKFDSVVMSSMNRAKETAQIMIEHMNVKPDDLKITSDSILEEGAPHPPEPPSPNWRPEYKQFYADGARIEAAFRKYIHRASPKQKNDSYELLVCHANVIRYFVMRALQLPPEAWLRFSLANSSITWIVVRRDGNVHVRALGDFGHLPHEKISFT